jgi:hypothetical protein
MQVPIAFSHEQRGGGGDGWLEPAEMALPSGIAGRENPGLIRDTISQ